MLFNSYPFLLLFLPTVLLGFHLLRWAYPTNHRSVQFWLVSASLLFYGWWDPKYVFLLLGSIGFNYWITTQLWQMERQKGWWLLVLGVASNLFVLGYFKYAGFIANHLDQLFHTSIHLGNVVLPLAISFFTFQQVASLVDSWKHKTEPGSLLTYLLFSLFFPQLIAGPIVRREEMYPQFVQERPGDKRWENLAVGLTLFFFGLFKKVIIADEISGFVAPVFATAERGADLTFLNAWAGACAFTLQIYFDFSGYSDMAIGLARLFGIRLPMNFNSPYKSTNIIQFWHRWHISLSRFLRDYLYIPLGGNRRGAWRRYANLLFTMLLGGIWHGVGWTFIIWGGLHGFYLMVNHAILSVTKKTRISMQAVPWALQLFGRLITFLAVMIAWIFFRAESFAGALHIIRSMFSFHPLTLPLSLATHLGHISLWLSENGVIFKVHDLIDLDRAFLWLLSLFLFVQIAPNTQQIMRRFEPVLPPKTQEIEAWNRSRILWQPTIRWAVWVASMATLAIFGVNRVSGFLYYQF